MKKSNSTLKLDLNEKNDSFFINKINLEKENDKNLENENSISLPKHKTFLLNILELIKISQNDYLSQISFNSKKNNNKGNINKIIIKMLSNLKNDLIMILKDNTENKAKIQNNLNLSKSVLVKSIFDFERENVNVDVNINEIKSNTEKKRKNKNINNDNDSYKYNIELPHLKLLNFRIENQLAYIDIMIKLKNKSINDFKNERNRFDEDDFYIFCDSQNDMTNASEYIHDELINIRNKFKLIVKQKDIQNKNLTLLNANVISLKEEVECLGKKSSNDYVNTSDIINEDSREYYTKTNICTNENYIDSNNNIEDNNCIFMKNIIIQKNNITN